MKSVLGSRVHHSVLRSGCGFGGVAPYHFSVPGFWGVPGPPGEKALLRENRFEFSSFTCGEAKPKSRARGYTLASEEARFETEREYEEAEPEPRLARHHQQPEQEQEPNLHSPETRSAAATRGTKGEAQSRTFSSSIGSSHDRSIGSSQDRSRICSTSRKARSMGAAKNTEGKAKPRAAP
jgi:hypothetical protein